jgi:hypothetical protein
MAKEINWRRSEEELTAGPQADRFVSASMLSIYGKLFDDGLYAAVEIAVQPGKSGLLSRLAPLSPVVSAAAQLGGLNEGVDEKSQSIIQDFLGNEVGSKPIGFYTWNNELRRIFQQDRLLQQELPDPAERAALATAIVNEPEYGTYLEFIARLTNPPVSLDLRKPDGAFFFPASRSHEGDLVKKLFADRPIPEGFSLVNELIRRIRDKSFNLDLTDASGWYDWQTWALEPLVLIEAMPEASRISMDNKYREQLEELFKAIIALTRETHVKQLELSMVGAALLERPSVPIVPELTVEPLPTYYERRAMGYDFVRRILESRCPLTLMRRVTPAGPATVTLDEELAEITAVFRGAAAVSRQELGMQEARGQSEVQSFRDWAKRFQRSSHSQDIRMMVPVFYDVQRQKTKVWAILGWATRDLRVSFKTPPNVSILQGRPRFEWGETGYAVAYPVFKELYVSRILDRDEFRSHCDRYKTVSAIVENLSE